MCGRGFTRAAKSRSTTRERKGSRCRKLASPNFATESSEEYDRRSRTLGVCRAPCWNTVGLLLLTESLQQVGERRAGPA